MVSSINVSLALTDSVYHKYIVDDIVVFVVFTIIIIVLFKFLLQLLLLVLLFLA